MACSRCHIWDGNPCAVCRTVSRITYLVQTGRLLKVQESAVLQSLRDTAGALSDLAEQAGPILRAELETSDVRDPGSKEAPDNNPGGPASSHRAAPAPREPAEEKEDKRPRTEESEKSGAKKAPAKAPKEKKVRKDKKKGDLKRKKSPERAPRSDGGDDPQERIDTHVSENPRSYGLGIIPRGSAEAHFSRREEDNRGDRPPPEPDRPPPPRPRDPAPRGRPGGPRERGTKGKGHRERGWDRARKYWQGK